MTWKRGRRQLAVGAKRGPCRHGTPALGFCHFVEGEAGEGTQTHQDEGEGGKRDQVHQTKGGSEWRRRQRRGLVKRIERIRRRRRRRRSRRRIMGGAGPSPSYGRRLEGWRPHTFRAAGQEKHRTGQNRRKEAGQDGQTDEPDKLASRHGYSTNWRAGGDTQERPVSAVPAQRRP